MENNPKISIVYSNERFGAQIQYIFDVMLSSMGLNYEISTLSTFNERTQVPNVLLISYDREKIETQAKYRIHIYESSLFSKQYLDPESMPQIPLESFDGLPIIYQGRRQLEGDVRCTGNLIETDIDIVASSFFMLARYEEILVHEQDKFGRFPATASLAYKESFLERPIVNEYIELLWSWIDNFNLGFKRRELWGGKDLAVCLTHDVDYIQLFNRVRSVLGAILCAVIKRKKPGNLIEMVRDYSKTVCGMRKDPYNTFEMMLDLERKFQFTSSFYFIAGGSTKHDTKYGIRDVGNIIELVGNAGCEIGVHGSFDSYTKPQRILAEKARLEEAKGSAVVGSRQHFLRWETPTTWRILEKAGLKYDTTLSFVDHVGFRCGICYPFKPFDILENRVLDIWEIPLIAMDGSLFDYQNLSAQKGLDVLKSLIDVVEQYKGIFVTLWHNNSFYELESPDLWLVYSGMLEYISNKNAFCDTVDKVLTTWRKTVEMQSCNKGK